mgnify:FL=1
MGSPYMMTPDPFESWLFGEKIYKPNEDQKNKYFVVSLSGGKDSTALLLKLLDHDVAIDEVIWADTGKEFPEMYDHIRQLREVVERRNIKFTILEPEKSFDYLLGHHVKTKGKNKGEIGYSWPDHMNRWCTSDLKQQTIKRYYKKLKKEYQTVEFIGYAADELDRTEKNQDNRLKEFPLVNWDMTEEEALQYCYSKGYDWGGLYEVFHRSSCYLCPLSQLGELKYVFENYPSLWLDMRRLDDMSKREFRSDYSLAELEHKFIREFYEELFEDNVSYGNKAMKQDSLFSFAS